MIPTSPAYGEPPEYADLARHWADLISALPPISGFRITSAIPDYDDLALGFIDLDPLEQVSLYKIGEAPGRELTEYKFRLGKARRKAIRQRLTELVGVIDVSLPRIIEGVPRDSRDRQEGAAVTAVMDALREIEALLGDTVQRTGRWGDMHRHIHFREGHDWHDIQEMDWPSVKTDIEAAGLHELDPLEVPLEDLDSIAAGASGAITLGMPWEKLSADRVESLVYDLLRSYPHHRNTQWLTHTNAPDRGRDISFDRVLHEDTGTERVERVLVQVKHWTSKPVNVAELQTLLGQVQLWTPPPVHGLIVVTTGKFSIDAVDLAESRNRDGHLPRLDLWESARLESLVSQQPAIIGAYGLR
jgi:hypothetical protein